MYSEEFDEIDVDVDQLCLDPNNPRFWTEKTTRDVADRRIPDQDIQERAAKDIENYGVPGWRGIVG